MSLIWFLKELWHDIKTSVFKIFIWKTTQPEKSYGYHPNPHLIFWIGFGFLLYLINIQVLTMNTGIMLFIAWLIFCYLLKRYWSGTWRTFKKRMEGVE